MKQIRVSFPSGELLLEGILAIPQGAGPFPAVIVCHPHPLYGGSMDNNVVYSLSEKLTQASLASFKFNFRGVGGSQGEFSQGIGEQEDVKAAISFISTVKEVDSKRIGLAGYSAGAGFAFPIGFNDARIKALAAVSPPLLMFNFDFLKSCPKPKLLISGSRDDLIPTDQFLEFCQNLPEPKECESIEGADHFWWGYESSLAAKVTAFFTKVL
ncbi:MAG: dienelactone hydrolase family protein [Dehalococcoidia bacterium]|nr:dienelactone hydrolase family protein [Dehalococcoidia bacterium]